MGLNMTMRDVRALFTCALLFPMAACASYLSTKAGPGHVPDGIVYFLPKRPIVVQIAVASPPTAQPPGDVTPKLDDQSKGNKGAKVEGGGNGGAPPQANQDDNAGADGDNSDAGAGTDADTSLIETPSILSDGYSVPDISARFVLSDPYNLIGENSINITVGSNGLLTSANSTATSGLPAIAQSIATAAGDLMVAMDVKLVPADTAPTPCAKGGTYSIAIWPDDYDPSVPHQICDLDVVLLDPVTRRELNGGGNVEAADTGAVTGVLAASRQDGPDQSKGEGKQGAAAVAPPDAPPAPAPTTHPARLAPQAKPVARLDALDPNSGENNQSLVYNDAAGIYYRVALPYLVRIRPHVDDDDHRAVTLVAYSPDLSPTLFLPVKRTVFSKNIVTLGLKDGIVNSFAEDETGELVALAQIPAQVLQAYFAAIGSTFSSLTTNENDASALALARGSPADVRVRDGGQPNQRNR